MKMKRIWALLLTVVMLAGTAGCGSGSSAATTAAPQTTAAAAETTAAAQTQAPAATTAAPAQTTAAAQTEAPATEAPETAAPETTAAQPSGSNRVDTVTIAMASAAETLNPYYITGNYGDVIFDMIFDRFFDYKAEGEITPRLADSYETGTDSEGNMTITFHLNPNAKWHDGEPLTANDVLFTARLVTDPQITTNRRTYWASLKGTDDSGLCENPEELGVTVVDDQTVMYTMKQVIAADTYMYIEARFQYVLPEHLLKDKDVATIHQDDYFQHPVGSGPLIFDSQVAGERVELVANMDYFRGTVNMDRLIVKTMEATNYVSALMSGEIDAVVGNGLGDIPLDDWEYINTVDGVETSSLPSWTYQYMTINWEKEYFQDPRVRKAISIAISRQNIVDQLLMGQGIYSVCSVTPTSRYFNDAIAADPYNPEEAKALLDAAGWDYDRVLDFCVPIGNKIREKSAVLIQQDLAAVGIKTEIRMVDFATEVVELREGKTDFGLLGGGGSVDPDDVRINFNSKGANNFSMLPDQSFYDLMDAARCAQTFEERKALYDEWSNKCFDETPYIWLYHPNQLVAYRDIFEHYPCENFIMINWRVLEWTFK